MMNIKDEFEYVGLGHFVSNKNMAYTLLGRPDAAEYQNLSSAKYREEKDNIMSLSFSKAFFSP